MRSTVLTQLTARLVTMHAYMRPAGSLAERTFADRYLAPLGAVRDMHGNYSVVVGTSAASRSVLWSCHTDTVHRISGSQKVRVVDGQLTAPRSSCLGADDTAGVFLCSELVRLGVPGRYMFHFGEERGCIGSRALVRSAPDWLPDIRYAIALDRAGYSDVISHQMSSRTASDAFCDALASRLSSYDAGAVALQYQTSAHGLYTDTESYAEDVPECTNLSVGYHGAHGASESLDIAHVLTLLEALASIDVTALPCDRDPAAQYAEDGRWKYLDDFDWDYLTAPLWRPSRSATVDRLYRLCDVRDREPIGKRHYRTAPRSDPRSAPYWSLGNRDRDRLDLGPIFPDADADDATEDIATDNGRRDAYLDSSMAEVQATIRQQIARKGKL